MISRRTTVSKKKPSPARKSAPAKPSGNTRKAPSKRNTTKKPASIAERPARSDTKPAPAPTAGELLVLAGLLDGAELVQPHGGLGQGPALDGYTELDAAAIRRFLGKLERTGHVSKQVVRAGRTPIGGGWPTHTRWTITPPGRAFAEAELARFERVPGHDPNAAADLRAALSGGSLPSALRAEAEAEQQAQRSADEAERLAKDRADARYERYERMAGMVEMVTTAAQTESTWASFCAQVPKYVPHSPESVPAMVAIARAVRETPTRLAPLMEAFKSRGAWWGSMLFGLLERGVVLPEDAVARVLAILDAEQGQYGPRNSARRAVPAHLARGTETEAARTFVRQLDAAARTSSSLVLGRDAESRTKALAAAPRLSEWLA